MPEINQVSSEDLKLFLLEHAAKKIIDDDVIGFRNDPDMCLAFSDVNHAYKVGLEAGCTIFARLLLEKLYPNEFAD